MELGKRKTKMETYIDSMMESPEKKQKIADFDHNLRQFYRRKWNAPVKPPMVHGLEFDLYKLYEVVNAFGGWQKVSQYEKWGDVAEQFGVKEDILGGDNAIKVLYMRYLSKFEQNETVGDVDEMMESEMLRGRSRQQSFLATSECPVYIPRPTHAEVERLNSADADYSRLTKSLLSGLPNEIDFAMNVCTLLSHPGPRLLRVSNAPHIINLILAHIGIFDTEDDSTMTLYLSWKEKSGRDFFQFWGRCGADKDLLEQLLPRAEEHYVDDDEGLLAGIGPTFSSNDAVSWRVYQVATVLRNLSFETVNKAALADNWHVIKFCVLASNSKWTQLSTAALDTLSNLATDLDLSSARVLYQSGHSILKTIHSGIYSNDKFKLIRCMELLAGLASVEENENILCEFVSVSLLEKVMSYLLVKDIMLCVYTLECIYQLSEMGAVACDMLAGVAHAISHLVCMCTVEAVSFGPTGLAGMKVVEYHPPGTLPLPPTVVGGPSTAGVQYVPQSGGPSVVAHPPPPPVQQAVPHSAPPPQTATPVRAPPPPQPAVSTPSTTNGTRAGESKMESLTGEWMRVSCEWSEGACTSRGDLYAAYVDDMRNVHHSLSMSLQQFTNMIKSMFPAVTFKLPEGGTVMLAYGLKLNKPHRLVGSSVPPTAAHPVMKSILDGEQDKGGKKAKSLAGSQHASLSNGDERSGLNYSASTHTMKGKKTKEKEGMEGEEGELMCEWDGCGCTFPSSAALILHSSRIHVIEGECGVCKWPTCDATLRSKWSLITHIQDHHGNESVLREAAKRRREGRAPPLPPKYSPDIPRDMPQHPGYSRTAAIDAIRRHAFNYIMKDFTEEVEGPVTKCIRLTASLILRNVARYSLEGRCEVRRHERLISCIALSRLESNASMAQLLAELPAPDTEAEENALEENGASDPPSVSTPSS